MNVLKERGEDGKKLSIQAISVEHHRHLYLEIIDEKQLNATRVQCRLLKSRE
jgi:hypothetical protein